MNGLGVVKVPDTNIMNGISVAGLDSKCLTHFPHLPPNTYPKALNILFIHFSSIHRLLESMHPRNGLISA